MYESVTVMDNENVVDPMWEDQMWIDQWAEEREEHLSCTAGDYSPSNPWDAPGMSIKDFI